MIFKVKCGKTIVGQIQNIFQQKLIKFVLRINGNIFVSNILKLELIG
jgi:hypothetical protein